MDRRLYRKYCIQVKEGEISSHMGVHATMSSVHLTFLGHLLRWEKGDAHYHYIPEGHDGPVATGLDAILEFDRAAGIDLTEDLEFLLLIQDHKEMAERKVEVLPAKISEHPNADRLEVARVGEYRAIVGKGQFSDGELVAFIPTGTVVPEDVLKTLGLWDSDKGKGMLAGSDGQRCKEARLRGIVSHGLCYPVEGQDDEHGHYYVERQDEVFDVMPGDDVADFLGVEKYVRPIPPAMNGEVFNAGGKRTVSYDIENVRRYPDALRSGEPIVMTEKIHGTWCQIGVMPEALAHPEEGRIMVSSKGQAKKGLCFRLGAEANKRNLYVRAMEAYGLDGLLQGYFGPAFPEPVWLLGEVFGAGVQKGFHYGANAGHQDTIGFRAFDLKIGDRYASFPDLKYFCDSLDIPMVPVIHRGSYSKGILDMLTDGMTTVPTQVEGEDGVKDEHIREGVVVRPVHERHDVRMNDQYAAMSSEADRQDAAFMEPKRVILKSVSDDYLTRKHGTEHN